MKLNLIVLKLKAENEYFNIYFLTVRDTVGARWHITSLSLFYPFNRQWRSRATTSHTNCRSPESARTMKDCTSAGWHELTTARLWSTKLKPGWRSTPQPGLDGHYPLPRRAPRCTWQTKSPESPAQLWARTTWAQTRGCPPHLALTQPPTQLNTTLAQVSPWGRLEATSCTLHWFGLVCSGVIRKEWDLRKEVRDKSDEMSIKTKGLNKSTQKSKQQLSNMNLHVICILTLENN